MNNFKDQVLAQFQSIFTDMINALPKVFQFIFFVILCWLIVKLVLFILNKILIKSNVDKWSKKLSETKIFGNSTINLVLSKLITGIVKWFLILILLMAGANIFGITPLSDGIRTFFAYLPKLVTALAIFGGGAYLGTVVKKTIVSLFKSMDINGGNILGSILFYLIVVFTSITALDLAGIDTSIIKQNITLLLGSILLAFTISFGLGSREAISRLLFGYYSRKNIAIGAKVKINDISGVVVAIDNICLILATEEGKKVIFPIKDVVDSKVEFIS